MLAVHTEGKRSDLVFECRVGHTFTVEELLVAKEERLHDRLWTAYTALVELVALLTDLAAHDRSEDSHRRYGDRRERARAQSETLRRLIDDNRPVALPENGDGPAS